MMKKRYWLLQLIVLFIVFSLANSVYNAAVSISMAIASIYILFDCFRTKSLKGFYLPRAIYISIICFLGSVLLSSLFIRDSESVNFAIKYIYWSVPFFILFYLCSDEKVQKSILYAMVGSIFFTSGYSIYQFHLKPVGSRIGGFYANPNFFAVLLILVLPFLIMFLIDYIKKNNVTYFSGIYFGTIILGMFALYLTGSRGAMLGFTLGGIFLLVLCGLLRKQFKMLIAAILVTMMIVVIIISGKVTGGVTRSYDMERIYLLESSYHMWTEHKILGVGLNNWASEYQTKYILPQAKERNLIIPHNTVAWFFSATGILGGVGFLFFSFGILFFLVRMIIKNPENFWVLAMLWSFVGFSIHGLLDVGITMKSANRLFFALLGITVASLNWSFFKRNYNS